MTARTQSKLVTIADASFALVGETTPGGRVSYRIADLDAALQQPDDEMCAAFAEAVKRRLRRGRENKRDTTQGRVLVTR